MICAELNKGVKPDTLRDVQERLQRLREASRGCVAEGRVDPGIDFLKGMTAACCHHNTKACSIAFVA